MKQKLLIVFVAIFFATKFSYGQIGSSIPLTYTFIEGISPINNTITYTDNVGYGSVTFYALDAASAVVSSYTDNAPQSNVFTWSSLDMGTLNQNSTLVVKDSAGNVLETLPLTILQKPQWLNLGSYTNLVMNADSFNLHGTIPILNLIHSNTISNCKGIGGDGFGIGNANVDFDASWNMNTAASNLSSATALSFDLNSIGKKATKPNSSFQGNTNISLDPSFNLIADASIIWEPTPFEFSKGFNNVPLVGINAGQVFSVGALCVSAGLDFKVSPKAKAQVVLGYSGSQWGFVQNGSNATQVLGKIEAKATVKGELNTACASLFGHGIGIGTIARGSVTATCTIGAGFRHLSFATPQDTFFWGGKFQVDAEGEIVGLGHKEGTYGPKYFPNPNGADTSVTNFRMMHTMKDDFFDLSAKTAKMSSNLTPNSWAMGTIAARDSVLSIVWIDDINFGTSNTNLLITNYNAYTGNFSTPVSIANNDSVIMQPSVALLPSHNSIITYTQLDNNGVDTMQTVDANLKKQNIWFAIFDPISNSLIAKEQLTDPSGNLAEGEAKIHWGTGNQGIITWQVGDASNNGSDIYYTIVTENAGSYTFTPPTAITSSLQGFNYDIHVSYYDATNAIAEWVQDPDMNDSTTNNIMYSEWNGSSWSTPTQRYTLNTGYQVKDITMAANGAYGVEGFTYNYFNSDSTLVNGIYLGWWTNNDPNGSYNSITQEDSTLYYQLPKAAVSKNGLASLTLQIRDVSDPNDVGLLNLFLKDLNSTNAWDNVSVSNHADLGDLCDSTSFVWDASSAFGLLNGNGNDIGYLFTQEMDSVGNTHPGSHGQVFGNPNLNLVLRAFQVNSNSGTMSITDVQEPSTNPIYTFYQNVKSFNADFELKQNIPNPYNNETVIPFHIGIGGKVKLEVFNILGGQIATLLNQQLEPGDYATQFISGNLANGIYYYKLTVNNSSVTKKMVIAK